MFVRGARPRRPRPRAWSTKRKRAYAEARAVEVIEPCPDRIEPVADHPGAPWQVLPYERQLEIKHEQVDDALRADRQARGLRARADRRPPSSSGATATSSSTRSAPTTPATLVCGFHAPGSWERIVAVDDCLLASERGNAARAPVLAWCRAQGLAAYDRRTQEGLLRNLVVREGRRTGEIQVRLVTSPGRLDPTRFAEAVECRRPHVDARRGRRRDDRGRRDRAPPGTDAIDEELSAACASAICAEAFFQTNTEMAERLYGVGGRVRRRCTGWERVYDLFCGIGTIGLALAPRAGEVWGARDRRGRRSPTRSQNARAQRHRATRASSRATSASRCASSSSGPAAPTCSSSTRRAPACRQKIVRRIIEAAPKRIVYVSCNPTTLAPNAAQLVEAGCALRRVRPVDMFPQTPHIECVALLERT